MKRLENAKAYAVRGNQYAAPGRSQRAGSAAPSKPPQAEEIDGHGGQVEGSVQIKKQESMGLGSQRPASDMTSPAVMTSQKKPAPSSVLPKVRTSNSSSMQLHNTCEAERHETPLA